MILALLATIKGSIAQVQEEMTAQYNLAVFQKKGIIRILRT